MPARRMTRWRRMNRRPFCRFDRSRGIAQEFRELVISAGAEIAGEIVQRRPKPDPATLIGSGKVEELAGIAGSRARM